MFHRHFGDYVRPPPRATSRAQAVRSTGDRVGRGLAAARAGYSTAASFRLGILALVAEKPPLRLRSSRSLASGSGASIRTEPGRRLSDALTMLEENGPRDASQDPAGRKLYTADGGGRESPRRQQGPDRRYLRLLRRQRRRPVRAASVSVKRGAAQPARDAPPAPARPPRDARADPGDHRRARRRGEGDRAGLRAAEAAGRRDQRLAFRGRCGCSCNAADFSS